MKRKETKKRDNVEVMDSWRLEEGGREGMVVVLLTAVAVP